MSAVPVLFILSVHYEQYSERYIIKYIHLYGTVNTILLMVYVQSVINILSCIDP